MHYRIDLECKYSQSPAKGLLPYFTNFQGNTYVFSSIETYPKQLAEVMADKLYKLPGVIAVVIEPGDPIV